MISGCVSQPTPVYVKPYCSPISSPALPIIDRGELWDKLGDDKYRMLESYIDGLWGTIDEQRALISIVCAPTEE